MDARGSILLVEDDPNDIELTLSALAELDLARDVVVACDGAKALDYLYRRGAFASRAEGLPKVILLDLKLPIVNGVEVARTIKSDERLRSIPVVVLTSTGEPQHIQECYEAGVNALVLKSSRFPEFTDKVKLVGLFWALLVAAPVRLQ